MQLIIPNIYYIYVINHWLHVKSRLLERTHTAKPVDICFGPLYENLSAGEKPVPLLYFCLICDSIRTDIYPKRIIYSITVLHISPHIRSASVYILFKFNINVLTEQWGWKREAMDMGLERMKGARGSGRKEFAIFT